MIILTSRLMFFAVILQHFRVFSCNQGKELFEREKKNEGQFWITDPYQSSARK